MGKRQRTKHVPEELIEEILTNLPVKSLLRFKSVSKSWQSIICTKTFTNAHLKKSNHHRLIICSSNRTLKSSSLKFLPNDHLNFQHCYSPIPSFQHRNSSIVGSCNGLILLAFKSPRDLILWNPSTRHVNNNIPPPAKWNDSLVFGFGYDDLTDDYKIVSIFMVPHMESLETHMYSLKTNSWKKLDDFYVQRRNPIKLDHGKYLNGKLHWKVGCGNTTVIVSLDLAEGKYEIVPHPQNTMVSDENVFFMNKYGGPESWTSTRDFSYSDIPIWLAENGDVSVSLRESTIIVYDQRIKSRVYNTGYIAGYCIYVETLVSPSRHQNVGQ